VKAPDPFIVRIAGEPNRYASLHPDIGNELVERNVIWVEDGQYYIKAADAVVLNTNPDLAICDFCGESNVQWRAQAHGVEIDIPLTATKNISPDAWAACDACGVLIQNGNREGLLDRAIFILGTKYDIPKFLVRQMATEMHGKFWSKFRTLERWIQ
jgi:hypothetical protein